MNRILLPVVFLGVLIARTLAQTAFVDFETPGQYATNFNAWNDVGGTDGGNYSFQASTNAGVGGGGGVAVFQDSDTTAVYRGGSWNLSTNGSVVVLSVFLKANGQSSGNKVQLGMLNTSTGGLNNNAGAAFESFRFIPTTSTTWSLREQLRSGETLTENVLGDVNPVAGHWYKFAVSLTNVSGASGNCNASCALYDYGADAWGPETNIVGFSTVRSNAGLSLTTGTTAWPALRAFQSGGIDAWDNFTVYTPASKPIIVRPLTNVVAAHGQAGHFAILADGPGPITYQWYTNGVAVPGANTAAYTSPPLDGSYTSVSVIASNANGSTTGTSAINTVTVSLPTLATLDATGIKTTAASLNGIVTSTGGEVPDVSFYYGTSDGGTDTNAWATSLAVGPQSGSFSSPATGLLSGTQYFFTARARNSAGSQWATPSRRFTTEAVTLAEVTNRPVSAVQATTAVFNGEVLSTGGDAFAVSVHYGTNDGGTNLDAWTGHIDLGQQAGVFSQGLSGLLPKTTYFATARVVNAAGARWAAPSVSFTTLETNTIPPLVAVLTYHNGNARHGVNAQETQLTLSSVGGGGFGKVFSHAVDGYVYAQPLIMTNVTIPGKGIHNVVYVVTEHNSVYAFDADSAAGANSAPLWQISFLNPAAGVTSVPGGDVGTSDIVPEVGITATPVIDAVTATLYIEAKTKETTGPSVRYVHRLHALDLATGAERTSGSVANSPVIVDIKNYPGTGTPGFADNDGAGHVIFNTQRQHSRPALTLLNGVIYIGYASHGDNQPYHGWLFAYDAHTLAQLSVYNSTPNGGLGGFWQGGGGATVDDAGNLYLETGNGSFNATGSTFDQAKNSFAMSVMKFSTTNGVLKLQDFFSPHDEASLSDADIDLGSGASIVLPDSVGSTAHPHLLAASGKGSRIYLLDRDNLGHFNRTSDSQIVQTVGNAFSGGQNGSYMTPVFFNNTLYYIGMNDRLKAFRISNGLISGTPVQSPTVFGDKGSSSPSLSANGTNDAIIWAIESDAYASSGPAILHAYNAGNVAQELYNSSENPARDNPGGAVKFTVPTVANGKVYVGTQYQLSVYGAGTFLATPAIVPKGGIFTNSVTVTITDATPGVSLYYTLDGTTPGTNSIPYTGPFVLNDTAGVQAIAVKPGAVNSGIASASFINSASVGSGSGLLGSYYTAHQPFDPFSGDATLIRVDTTVDFDWGSGSPDPSIGADNFTVRWTGAVEPQFSETYTFYTTTDDGVRLWVDGQLIVDHWVDQGPTTWTETIPLVARQRYNIVMEYYENGGGAVAQLQWSSPSQGQAVIPQSQLYPVPNPAPVAVLTAPATNAFFTASASVTVAANAAAQFNSVRQVDFYANTTLIGTATDLPYTITATGLSQGKYALRAVAIDGSGLKGTSAPVSITVTAGSGAAYGLATRAPIAPYGNMPVSPASGVPAKLSQTGFFADVPNLLPVNGMVPYGVIAPLWSDGALKTRWMAVPNTGAPYTPDEQIAFSPTGEWSFPSGTVFVKHFDLVTDYSNPVAPRRRLETRLLVRDPNGAVYGVTYKWRPDNSEADLLTNSLSESIIITNSDSSTRTQAWYYPSPADCLVCHTKPANYVLGVKTRQLDSEYLYSLTGTADNQLRTLNHLGLIYPAIDEANIVSYSHLEALTNAGASLEDRARSYLDANCAQCHRPGATGPSFDARWDTPLAQQNLIDALPDKGSLGVDNGRLVKPKDIWRSLLYVRAHSLDPAVKMPTLARNVVDTNSLAVVADWIESLPGTLAVLPPEVTPPGGTFLGSVSITVTPTDEKQAVYYTLDGSLPTVDSPQYNGPILLSTNATLRVKAFATGSIDSASAPYSFTIIPAVQIASAKFADDGAFQLQVIGEVGKTYRLEGSINLADWLGVSTNTPAASPFLLSDPGTSGVPYRFYRAVQQ
ncbi:MAG TPA: chitobiase/beta-hexosaminidase C-terminal domain-containing protein [Candidatus Limnocylindria bacterium]|nr:chitobiase/beta-hexosaminidase C-terminal domain-containing protein [Candidatus Limnocylindria bacterium]